MSNSETTRSPRAPRTPALLPWAAAAVCAGFLWINFDKAAWWGIQGWGRPYWWLDYHHGFVRRGLMGQLFQMVFGRVDEGVMASRIAVIHRLFCLALAAMSLFLVARALQAQRGAVRFAVVAAVGVWLAVGEVWPTLAYNQGYLDVIVLDVAVLAALMMRRGWTIPAAAFACVGPFIHEYFLFLTPFVIAAHRSFGAPSSDHGDFGELQSLDAAPEPPSIPRDVLIVGAAALLATLLVTFAPSMAASAAEIAAMPLSTQDRDILVHTTMGQTFSESLSGSTGLLVGNLGFVLKNFAFFLAPAAVALGALLFWRRPPIPLRRWVRVAAGLAPLAALLVAWDLSRLTVNVGLTAGLLLMMTAEDDPGEASRGALPALIGAGVLALLGAVYVLAPMAYVYYPPGPTSLFPAKAWPVEGRSTLGMTRFWPGAQVRPYPSERLVGLSNLAPGRSVEKDKQIWRLPAGPDGLLFSGPYAEVGGGRHEARLHLVLSGAPDSCRAATAALHARFGYTGRAGGRVLAPEQPAIVTANTGDPCRLSIISAPFSTGWLGERQVETPFSLALPLPAVLDSYVLEPAHAR